MLITAKGIYKSYDTLEVLKGIELIVQPEEIVAIVGPSGAGKTTLLNIIGTIDTADSGDVIINDIHLNKLRSKKL